MLLTWVYSEDGVFSAVNFLNTDRSFLIYPYNTSFRYKIDKKMFSSDRYKKQTTKNTWNSVPRTIYSFVKEGGTRIYNLTSGPHITRFSTVVAKKLENFE